MNVTDLSNAICSMDPQRAETWGHVVCRMASKRAEDGSPEMAAVLGSVGLAMLDRARGQRMEFDTLARAVHAVPLAQVESWGHRLCVMGRRRQRGEAEAWAVFDAVGLLLLDHAADHRIIGHAVDSEFEKGSLLEDDLESITIAGAYGLYDE